MNNSLKIIASLLLSSGLVATAQAHDEYFMNNTSVWIAGTYHKTSNNGLSVGDTLTSTTSNNPFIPFDGVRPTFLEPPFNWNYALGAMFNIPHSPSYAFISYEHYDSHEARTDGTLFTNLTPFFPLNDAVLANANVSQRADELRFGLTRMLQVGRNFCLDLSAFLEYDKLKREVYETANQPTIPAIANRTTENKMRGFGPGLGATGRVSPFKTAPNWNFFLGMMNTLLYTKQDYQQLWNLEDDDDGLRVRFISIDPEQTNAVVNKSEIKFGLEYFCFLERRRDHDLKFSLALGMQFINYINAFKNGNLAFNFDDDNYLAVSGGSAEDWGRWGPYLQFTIGGARG